MSSSKVYAVIGGVSNVGELTEAVLQLTSNLKHPWTVNVFGRTGEPLRVKLIEDTLTDGSTVWNICIE